MTASVPIGAVSNLILLIKRKERSAFFRRTKLLNGKKIDVGHTLIGLPSTGCHSNGYSLVRKVLLKDAKLDVNEFYPEFNKTLGEELLTPTKIYVKAIKHLLNADIDIKGMSHITGGGFFENIPRMLKEGTHAVVKKDSYPIPPIFEMLAVDGDIEEQMMYNTFKLYCVSRFITLISTANTDIASMIR